MYGFSQRSAPKKKDEEERKKRGSAGESGETAPVVPPIPAKRAGNQNKPAGNAVQRSSGNRPSGAPRTAGNAAPNTVQAPAGLPKPQAPKNSRFYTNGEGVTGDGVRPSTNRTVTTTAPQKGGFPAARKPLGLPAPEAPKAAPGPQANPDFYSNKEGQTTRGFGTSSSRAVVPSGPRTGTSLVPVEQPANAGASNRTTTTREPNYKARAEGKARAARDTAQYESERAAQDRRFKEAGKAKGGATQKPSTTRAPAGFRSRMPTRFGVAGPVSAIATGIPEGRDVARVVQDEDSTKLDVANQVAEGTGRTASTLAMGALGAKGGAAIGAFGGPLAPITVPLGGLIGGAGGAALGWWGADQAIEKGRELTGTDPSSPVDRVDAQPVPVPMDQPALIAPQQTQPQPQQADNQSVGTLQPMPAQQPVAAPQPMENDITREGNSFSGGVIRQGYTVNGEPQGGPNLGNPQSDQNRQAIENLMARTPEFGAGGFRPSRDNRPNFYIGRDSSVEERAERAALRGASRAYDGAQNGQLTANQLRTLRGIASDRRSDETSRANNTADNQTRLDTAQINQQAQNQRTGATLALDQTRLEGEQQERGFRVRQAQQVERLRQQYQAAETDEQRGAIAEQLKILNGDSNQSKGDYKAQMVDVPVDPERPELGTRQVPYTFDSRTGQWRAGVEQGAERTAPRQNHINALMNNPSLAAQFDEQYGPGSAAQYLGAN